MFRSLLRFGMCGGSADATAEESRKRQASLEVAEKVCADRRMHAHLSENIIVEDFSHPITDFYDFARAQILGAGCSGAVRLSTHKETGIQYAIKTLSKRNVMPEKVASLRQEIRFMTEIDHPNIVTLHEVFENRDYIYLVLELCTGGELLTRLNNLPHNKFPEETAKEFVKTMLECIAYLHDRGIVHRDIKLENFVFEDESSDSAIKLIDFGLSKHFKEDEAIQGAVGTPFYVAPEVLIQGAGYSEKCDVWSVGVIAFMLLAGYPPFQGEDDRHTLELVRTKELNLRVKAFQCVSPLAVAFLTAAMERDTEKRPPAKDLLNHPWFLAGKKPRLCSLNAEVISRIKAFGRLNTFVKIALEVLAHTLTADQIVELRKQFQEFDMSHAGVLRKVDVEQTLKQYGTFVPSEIDKIFAGMDIESDNNIRYHEFIAAALPIESITEANYRAGFLILSKHDPEFISRETVRELLGLDSDDEKLVSALEEAGLNPEEHISYEKFKEILYQNCDGANEIILV